jgi:hypothetical protein
MRYEAISVGCSTRKLSSIIGTKKSDSMGCRRTKSAVPEKGSEPNIYIFIKIDFRKQVRHERRRTEF